METGFFSQETLISTDSIALGQEDRRAHQHFGHKGEGRREALPRILSIELQVPLGLICARVLLLFSSEHQLLPMDTMRGPGFLHSVFHSELVH